MTCCQIDPCPSWWSGHITGALSLLLTPPTTFSIISTIRNFTGLGAIPSTLPQKKIYKKQVLACMTTSYLPIELGVLLIGSSTLTYNDRRCMGPKVNFSPFPKHHSHWKKKKHYYLLQDLSEEWTKKASMTTRPLPLSSTGVLRPR